MGKNPLKESLDLMKTETTQLTEVEPDLFTSRLRGILDLKMPRHMVQFYKEKGLDLKNDSIADAVNASLILRALGGDVGAYVAVRDTLGLRPVENIKNDVVVRIEMSPRIKELGE